MRVPLCFVSVVLTVAVLAFPARAQDAQKLVDQYLKAEGGSKALSRIQTLSIEGTFTNPADRKSGTYTFSTKLPNRFYTELVSGDVTLIEAYNGKSAWHQTAKGELATLTGAEGSQLEAAGLYYNTHLMNAKKNRMGLGFAEKVNFHGRDAQEIEATTASGVKWRTAFDSQTHLIVREQATVGGIDEELIYDDYRIVNGVKIPFKIALRRGKDVYEIVVTRAEINGRLGERVFDFPKKSQVQLPDLKALFKEIEANQKSIDKIKENYAGTRDEEETQYDKTGKISKRELHQYDFFYLDGDEVSTLVKKDGKPLSAEEQKKENEKTQKEIENIQKRQAKKEAKEEKAKNEGKEQKDDDDVGIDTFLRACQFVNPRRERFRGQDLLVFDFEPNPEFKPHKLAEKVVHELAGVVWIDEKARDVARLEAYFVGDFHFGGGLIANLQKGTSFAFEQAYINNEVWLPTYMEAHLGARVLLLKTFKVNEVTRYSNYKKFNVESIATMGKPKGAADSAVSATDPTPNSAPKPE
jgi:outer membrane lipoprotein-sorting protein